MSNDIVAGYLEIGVNDRDEVVVNHPKLQADENGVGHIVFSPDQARAVGGLLLQKAGEASSSAYRKQEAARRKAAELIPVDRNARVLTDGTPENDNYREILPSGMQREYVVLSAEERAKGFVRPVRSSYRHTVCGAVTTMSRTIAETYARDPTFYSGTFCIVCRHHFPLAQFTWTDSDEFLGT